jgi:hypothetical protein
MTRQHWTALGLVLGLIGLAAVLLVQMSGQQRLGPPGLKVVAEPTYGTNNTILRTESVSLPAEVLNFTSKPEEVTELEANWLPPDTLFGRRVYQAPDGFVARISVVLMGTDRTSIHKPQFCLDGQGWKIEKTETVTIPMARPHRYDLQVMKLTTSKLVPDFQGQPRLARGVYVYWFVTDQLLTPYHGERMWWMARDLLRTGVLQRWAYVTYFTVCWPGQEEAAYDRMKELIVASVPEFQLAAGPPPQVRATAALYSSSGKEKN